MDLYDLNDIILYHQSHKVMYFTFLRILTEQIVTYIIDIKTMQVDLLSPVQSKYVQLRRSSFAIANEGMLLKDTTTLYDDKTIEEEEEEMTRTKDIVSIKIYIFHLIV